jgi:hypothetical protein
LVEDYYKEFERAYDQRYRDQYGPWRKVAGEVLRKFLECGDRKVWAADPLACRKCGARLRIISFVDQPSAIEKILRQLELWDPRAPAPAPVFQDAGT